MARNGAKKLAAEGKITVGDFAAQRGVSPEAIYNAGARGLMTPPSAGILDAKVAAREWLASHQAARTAAPADDDTEAESANLLPGESFMQAKTRRERAAADLAEAKAAETKGDLLQKSAVEAAFFAAGRELRGRLQAIAPRIAMQVSAADARSAQRIIAAEIDAALAGLVLPDVANQA